MGGKSIVNLINTRINIYALRVTVLAFFVLSVVVTVTSLLTRIHILHNAHVILTTLTFLLIALYLIKSAEIASLRIIRETRFRMTVDARLGFVEHIPAGSPVYNVCAGALVKNGVWLRGAEAMSAISRCETVAAEGNAVSREGYAITKSTFEIIGVTLSDDVNDCSVRILLGPFDLETSQAADFVLTRDKVTHMLTTVYISRLYTKYTLLNRILLACALALAAALLLGRQFTYAGAVTAFWAAGQIIIIRHIERLTTRLSFESIKTLKTR